ncbi:MAG: hypothetical protein HQK56_15370 [Deltaproteobacteria bacterium]|nr:hypothetical protein [Deltaproteobacteria bacterium]
MKTISSGFFTKIIRIVWIAGIIGLSLVSYSLSAENQAAAPDAVLTEIDGYINELGPYIDGWPPNIKSKKELNAVRTRLTKVLKYANRALGEDPDNLQLLCRVGELYRMGHNIDMPRAWTNSEKALKRALKLDSKMIEAWLTLGALYVNTGLENAKQAEECFLTAQKLYGEKPLLRSHRGLFFAYCYQARMPQALEEANLVLKLTPDDPQMKKLRDIVQSQIDKSSRPN